MMKRLIALLVALMMLLSAAAVAEESTLWRLSLYDPQISYNDEVIVDMTGLNIDFDAALTDSGLTGAMIELYTGENYDFLTGAYAQIDENGLSFWLDGMSSIYSYDLSTLVGMNPYVMLSALPLRMLGDSIDFSAINLDVNIPAEARMAAVDAIFGGMITGTENGVSTFALDKEQGAEIMAAAMAMAEEGTAAVGMSADELGMDVSTFEIAGTLQREEAYAMIESAGKVYMNDGSEIPFTLEYEDAGEECAMIIGLQEGAVEFMWMISPNEEIGGIENAFVLTGNGGTALLSLTSGYADTDNSLLVDLYFLENDELVFEAYTSYAGDYEENDGAPYVIGYFDAGLYAEGESYSFGTDLYMERVDMDTAEWLADSSTAIDVMNMTENDTNMAMMGLMGVIGNVVPVLQTNVPGLAPYIDMLMEGTF